MGFLSGYVQVCGKESNTGKADRSQEPTSTLSLIETKRALIRAETERLITNAAHQRLKGIFRKVSASWNFLDKTGDVRKKACMPFPVEPVRSLDAIHLVTVLEFLLVYPDITILTFIPPILFIVKKV